MAENPKNDLTLLNCPRKKFDPPITKKISLPPPPVKSVPPADKYWLLPKHIDNPFSHK